MMKVVALLAVILIGSAGANPQKYINIKGCFYNSASCNTKIEDSAAHLEICQQFASKISTIYDVLYECDTSTMCVISHDWYIAPNGAYDCSGDPNPNPFPTCEDQGNNDYPNIFFKATCTNEGSPPSPPSPPSLPTCESMGIRNSDDCEEHCGSSYSSGNKNGAVSCSCGFSPAAPLCKDASSSGSIAKIELYAGIGGGILVVAVIAGCFCCSRSAAANRKDDNNLQFNNPNRNQNINQNLTQIPAQPTMQQQQMMMQQQQMMMQQQHPGQFANPSQVQAPMQMMMQQPGQQQPAMQQQAAPLI